MVWERYWNCTRGRFQLSLIVKKRIRISLKNKCFWRLELCYVTRLCNSVFAMFGMFFSFILLCFYSFFSFYSILRLIHSVRLASKEKSDYFVNESKRLKALAREDMRSLENLIYINSSILYSSLILPIFLLMLTLIECFEIFRLINDCLVKTTGSALKEMLTILLSQWIMFGSLYLLDSALGI